MIYLPALYCGVNTMDAKTVLLIISDIREQSTREIEQGVLRHDLYQSTAALGGKDACDRIARALAARLRAAPPPPRAIRRG